MAMSADAGLNPWKTMWTSPSRTVGHLVQNRPGHRVLLLAALAGVSGTFLGAWTQNLGDSLSLQLVILTAVLVGSLWGVALLYLQGLLVFWTGKWFDGTGNGREIRTALAWGLLPTVPALILWLVALLVFGNALFASPGAGFVVAGWPLWGFIVVFAFLGVWSLVLTANAVGRVQGFSAWKGLANLALAGALLLVSLATLSTMV